MGANSSVLKYMTSPSTVVIIFIVAFSDLPIMIVFVCISNLFIVDYYNEFVSSVFYFCPPPRVMDFLKLIFAHTSIRST